MTNKKSIVKKILLTTWCSVGILFLLWVVYSYQSHGVDSCYLHDSREMIVKQTNNWYHFTPTNTSQELLVFFPGAMVDPKAYVPLCREIADRNIEVYLVKMPWRDAAHGYNRPNHWNLFADTTKHYTLCGHSKGGKMAAQFVYENPNQVDRLILIGTTHPKDISLAESETPVLKIYGSQDGVADEMSILQNKIYLPASARYVKIDGANHAQFGYYGFQLGDNCARISRSEQLETTVKIITEWIQEKH